MKKSFTLIAACTLALAALAFVQAQAQNPAPAELRPIQKVMQARLGWLKAMFQNLEAKNLDAVAKDAADLSAQAAKVAGGAEGERKELTLKLSDLAKAASDSAGKGEVDALQARLGEIKATCAACHDKYRDKK